MNKFHKFNVYFDTIDCCKERADERMELNVYKNEDECLVSKNERRQEVFNNFLTKKKEKTRTINNFSLDTYSSLENCFVPSPILLKQAIICRRENPYCIFIPDKIDK